MKFPLAGTTEVPKDATAPLTPFVPRPKGVCGRMEVTFLWEVKIPSIFKPSSCRWNFILLSSPLSKWLWAGWRTTETENKSTRKPMHLRLMQYQSNIDRVITPHRNDYWKHDDGNYSFVNSCILTSIMQCKNGPYKGPIKVSINLHVTLH